MSVSHLKLFIHRYYKSVGIVLAITGLAKIVSAFGHVRILQQNDPLLNVSYQHIFEIAGFVELAVSIICMTRSNLGLKACLTGWLATIFIAYRLGSMWSGFKRPCPCLGSLTDDLHISQHAAGIFLRIVLAYLLVGSYGTLFWLWRQKRKQSVTSAVGVESL